jgi:hypothetical protein
MNAARRVLTRPTLRKISRAHGLRNELAAAKWALRAERRWARRATASYNAVCDERDALKRELDNLTGEL